MASNRVRPARSEDWSAFRAAFEQVAGEGRWIAQELPVEVATLQSAFDRWVADRDTSFDVAVDEAGTAVGWALSTLSGDTATVGMGVVAAHRRTGLGTALLERLVAWARSRGAGCIELEVWATNAPAIGLYERFGFTIDGPVRQRSRRDGDVWDAAVTHLPLA